MAERQFAHTPTSGTGAKKEGPVEPQAFQIGTQANAKIVMSDLTVSPEVGLKPGKYNVRITRLVGGKETVFAKTNLELKVPAEGK